MKRPCGIYRTTQSIDDSVPVGVLVYYHNHGNPGPGVYPPERWANNRAVFSAQGVTVPDEKYADSLESLLPEGFYRVAEDFHCCDKNCQRYEAEQLVQLGYDGGANAILFVPQLVDGAVALPAEGTLVEANQLSKLAPLKVAEAQQERPERADLQ